jgi:hypothetical protein
MAGQQLCNPYKIPPNNLPIQWQIAPQAFYIHKVLQQEW